MHLRLRDIRFERGPALLILAMFLWYLPAVAGSFVLSEFIHVNSAFGWVTGSDVFLNLERPPLPKFIWGAPLLFMGFGIAGPRIAMTILAAATLVVTYLLGRELSGPAAGVVAVLALGTSHSFANYAFVAQAEPILAFFVTSLVLYVVTRGVDSKKIRLILGGLTVASLATRYAGVVYVLVPAIYIVYRSSKCGGIRSVTEYFSGGVLLTMITYAPYFLVRPPQVNRDLPQVGELILSIPGIQGAAYAFSFAVWHHYTRLSRGHLVSVMGDVYAYPPAWSYPYWVFRWAGPVFILGLVYGILLLRRGTERERFVALYVVGTFLMLLVVPIKKAYLVVPPLPVIAALFGVFVVRTAITATHKWNIRDLTLRGRNVSGRTLVVACVALVLLTGNVAVATPKVNKSMTPHAESGFDDIAGYLDANAADGAVVVTLSGRQFQYYADQNYRVEPPKFILSEKQSESDVRIFKHRIDAGEIDYVVLTRGNPVVESSPVTEYIRENGKVVFVADVAIPFESGNSRVVYRVSGNKTDE